MEKDKILDLGKRRSMEYMKNKFRKNGRIWKKGGNMGIADNGETLENNDNLENKQFREPSMELM